MCGWGEGMVRSNAISVGQVELGNIVVFMAQISIPRLPSIFSSLKKHWLTEYCNGFKEI